MTRGTRLVIFVAGVAGAVGAALAQNALDNNLQRGSGGQNAARPMPAMAPDIYTYNSVTGETEYNEANAFAQPIYRLGRLPSSYTEYHRDTVRPTTARDGVYTLNRSTGNYQYNPYNAFQPATYNALQNPSPPPPSYGSTRLPSTPAPCAPATTARTSSLAAPSYRVR